MNDPAREDEMLALLITQIIILFATELAIPAAKLALQHGKRPEDLTPDDLYWPSREVLEAQVRVTLGQPATTEPRQLTIEDLERGAQPKIVAEPIPPREPEGH